VPDVKPYERLWTLATGTACAVGLAAAFTTFPLVLLASLFATVGMLGALVVLPWLPRNTSWVKPLSSAAVLSGLLTWVCIGLAQVIGAATVALLVLLPATAPATAGAWAFVARQLGWHGPRLRARAAENAPRDDVLVGAAGEPVTAPLMPLPQEDLEVPDLMTDLDLCHAWRSSFVALQRATSVDSLFRVVTMRALYLDELERRAGPALHAWIGSGARAAGDPRRFLFGGTTREQ
jgi:hypothetical protein